MSSFPHGRSVGLAQGSGPSGGSDPHQAWCWWANWSGSHGTRHVTWRWPRLLPAARKAKMVRMTTALGATGRIWRHCSKQLGRLCDFHDAVVLCLRSGRILWPDASIMRRRVAYGVRSSRLPNLHCTSRAKVQWRVRTTYGHLCHWATTIHSRHRSRRQHSLTASVTTPLNHYSPLAVARRGARPQTPSTTYDSLRTDWHLRWP